MVVISEKSHAEHYRHRMMPLSSDAQPAHDSHCTWPSKDIREDIYYHDMGLIENLFYKLSASKFASWLQKDAD